MVEEPQIDSLSLRKGRGAFFTPWSIAEFLADWAVASDPHAKVLDPTSGEGVFLLAAAERLKRLGASRSDLKRQVHGVDVHPGSLQAADALLAGAHADARLLERDFFTEPTPGQLEGELPWMDAVIGNPPFVRYQQHRGERRQRSAAAALSQGVRLSGLASSWAALLVHSCAFLKPEGRVAMVLPAELLTVGYAEPIRRWLASRFAAVHLVVFEELQFTHVEENVVLLVARGSGGCGALALHQVRDAADLASKHLFDSEPVVLGHPADKWTDLMLPLQRRTSFHSLTQRAFCHLADYGSPSLGTVTGSNRFFALNEATRSDFGIHTDHLKRVVPPGARHVPGTRFTEGNWQQLKSAGERVWLLHPATDHPKSGLARYIAHGKELAVDTAYKCTVRDPWWRPPAVEAPDLLFTYMSHVAPRLVTNAAKATIVNSLLGVTLRADAPPITRDALPLLSLNSASMLGGELNGRAYGGGILKMEPREAGRLPVPDFPTLMETWERLSPRRSRLDELLRARSWGTAVAEVDRALLVETVGLSPGDVAALRADAARFRRRRTRREDN